MVRFIVKGLIVPVNRLFSVYIVIVCTLMTACSGQIELNVGDATPSPGLILLPSPSAPPAPSPTAVPTPTPTVITPLPSQNPQEKITKQGVLTGKKICIDPGHGLTSIKKQEKIAPNSNETKPAFVSGTSGVSTRVTEEQLNLIVALKLKARLEGLGAEIAMTRETAKTERSNIDRATFANVMKADLSIKIHANGSDNNEAHGLLMLVPGDKYIADGKLLAECERAGRLILEKVAAKTGAKSLGISKRSDMTGFNWTTVPVILLEMGFMSNPDEDRLLNTSDYQNKIVEGIVEGTVAYFKYTAD